MIVPNCPTATADCAPVKTTLFMFTCDSLGGRRSTLQPDAGSKWSAVPSRPTAIASGTVSDAPLPGATATLVSGVRFGCGHSTSGLAGGSVVQRPTADSPGSQPSVGPLNAAVPEA